MRLISNVTGIITVRGEFMANILLTRIDNRLVHGQVGVTWVRTLGANLIIVADDLTAEDPLQQHLMSMTAESSGVGIRFFSVSKTIDLIHKASDKQLIFLVIRNPEVAKRLLDGGVHIEKLNVGNMHFSKGKEKFSNKVYLDEQDVEDLNYLKSKNVEVFIQDVPDDKIIKF